MNRNRKFKHAVKAAPSTGAAQRNALVPAVPGLKEEKEGNI